MTRKLRADCVMDICSHLSQNRLPVSDVQMAAQGVLLCSVTNQLLFLIRTSALSNWLSFTLVLALALVR